MNEKRVMLLSAGLVHPSLVARHRLGKILAGMPGLRVEKTGRIASLARLRFPECAALVIYLHRRGIGHDSLDALDGFVREGGGLLALHSASASFKKEPGYFDILGGRFVSHGPVHEFTVSRCAGDAGVFADARPFTVRDELYLHEYDAGVSVHFTADWKGSTEPISWTRTHGKGRVCYISLGHCAPALKNPRVAEMVAEGLAWTIAGKGDEKT
jgi:uncharacterized protein